MKTKKQNTEIRSHFGFGEHWNELSQYQGYMPLDYKSWQSLKDQFFAAERYGFENPLPVNIRKDNSIIVVNLCGFKELDQNQVALCKTILSKEFVTIAH